MESSHECIQEVNLARLTLATETLVKSVEELNDTAKEQVVILKTVASQGARLDSVEGRQSKMERDMDGMYGRIRTVELFQAERTGAIKTVEQEQKETQNFRTTVKAGLVVAIILGALTAFLWLLDRADYGPSMTQQPIKKSVGQ